MQGLNLHGGLFASKRVQQVWLLGGLLLIRAFVDHNCGEGLAVLDALSAGLAVLDVARLRTRDRSKHSECNRDVLMCSCEAAMCSCEANTWNHSWSLRAFGFAESGNETDDGTNEPNASLAAARQFG